MVETPLPNLARGMQRTHGLYAQSFNRRHRRSGHLFQGRFGSVLVTSDAQFLMTVRYIARNPVEAGLCDDAAEWPWSSHAALLACTCPAWLDSTRLLAQLGDDGGDPSAGTRIWSCGRSHSPSHERLDLRSRPNRRA